MENVACNLCGSNDQRLVYTMPDAFFFPEEVFSIVECGQCRLGFVNPRPTFEEMQRYYPPEFYEYFTEHGSFHERRYATEAEIVEHAVGPSGRRLLDVGCANGDFPRFMAARGWIVEGVEPSETSSRDLEFPVYRSQFPDIPVETEQYDAVTAWAVLEHVHDPRAYFQKAATVLRPGGVFVFLVTNFESESSRSLYREDPPRHLYFFTEDTIDGYLRSSGMSLESVEYSDRVYEMRPVGWLVRAIRSIFGRPYRWEDSVMNRDTFIRNVGVRSRLLGSILFVLRHPMRALDRLALPVYERWQMLRGTYGIAIYVARKT